MHLINLSILSFYFGCVFLLINFKSKLSQLKWYCISDNINFIIVFIIMLKLKPNYLKF